MNEHQTLDTGWEIHTRRGNRHRISLSQHVWLDFDDPTISRKRWRVRVLDISEGGLSFVCLDDRPKIESGTRLTRAVIRAGAWRIRGELELTHLSTTAGTRRFCGARLLPSSPTETIKLRTLIASLSHAEVALAV